MKNSKYYAEISAKLSTLPKPPKGLLKETEKRFKLAVSEEGYDEINRQRYGF